MSIQLRRAWRAVVSLSRNPDDTAQVFTLIEALTGTSTPQMVSRRLMGSRLSSEQPEVIQHLSDRAALRRMPAGSLAHTYLRFVESEGITAEGLRSASDQGESDCGIPPSVEYYRRRMRDTHDLWHAVLGYRGDVLGEASVLAFTFAQTRNPAIGVLVLVGLSKLYTREARALILGGLVRGFRAAWFPEQEWERLLPLPIDEVRRRLGVGPPPSYAPVRTSDLRASGLIQ
jgi:ubiquinone biosynthesis protein COQ4